MKYTFELNDDDMVEIIMQSLKRDIRNLEKDLEVVKERNIGYVFEIDAESDIKEITRHIEALKLVKQYYGGTDD